MQVQKKSIHIVIFTGGLYPLKHNTEFYWKTHPLPEYVIAADSGLIPCVEYSFQPDVILGDFDSLKNPTLLNFFDKKIVEPFSKDKDYTDTELAVHKAYLYAKKLGRTPFITLVGGDRGRIDHLLNIYDSFSGEEPVSAWLCAEQAVYMLKNGSKMNINGLKENDYISIARTSKDFKKGKIISSGLKWESTVFRLEGMPSISNRVDNDIINQRAPVELKAYKADFLIILPLNVVVEIEE